MEFLIGAALAAAVALVASLVGLDLDRAFYPTVNGRFISNPGVPAWWPGFCLAYDVVAAACLSWLLARRPALLRVAFK